MATAPSPTERVRAALRADPRIAERARRVQVEEQDGALALTGSVTDVAQKRLAGVLAERALGQPVANRIRVNGRPLRTDAEVERHARDALGQDPWLMGREVSLDVRVERGVVTVRGRVPSLLRRRLVEATLWWVPGVQDVVNAVRVEPPEEDAPEHLADAVKTVLEKDPLVDEQEVAVHVTAPGVVTLTGLVDTPEERQAAENDAWIVSGVVDVVNRLDIARADQVVREYPPPGVLYHGE